MSDTNNEKYFNIFKNYKKMTSNLMAEISSYEGWSDEFSRKQVKELYLRFIQEFNNIDFTNFTTEELKTFDFQWFDDDLLLMPIWAIDCLPDGIEIYSINNEKIIVDKNKPIIQRLDGRALQPKRRGAKGTR